MGQSTLWEPVIRGVCVCGGEEWLGEQNSPISYEVKGQQHSFPTSQACIMFNYFKLVQKLYLNPRVYQMGTFCKLIY